MEIDEGSALFPTGRPIPNPAHGGSLGDFWVIMFCVSSYRILCPTTRDHYWIEPGPSQQNYVDRKWTFTCPSCGEEHEVRIRPQQPHQLERSRVIDIAIDLDLGEIIQGQHVVIKGIEMTTSRGSVLHYDFIPGFDRDDRELDTSWSLGKVNDDVGTTYGHGGEGGWGPDPDWIVRWGDERLGNTIPSGAGTLTVEVHHAHYWTPPGHWVRSFAVDLTTGLVQDVVAG